MRSLTRRAIPLSIALILAMAIMLLICGPASAAKKPNKPTVTKLELQPAPEPRPALEYQLLPGFLDQTPGNAALEYQRQIAEWHDTDNDKLDEQLADWLEMPLEKLPLDEVQAALCERLSILDSLDSLDRAARRDRCDWQLPIREKSPLLILMPELSTLRSFARLLVIKARLEIAEGKYEQAVKTLQTGYALSRHTAEAPTLIHALVGIAVSDMMTSVVEDLIARPDSPNMYWALTALPSPIISIRKAAAAEVEVMYLMVPELRDIDKIPSTPEHWRAFLDRVYENNNFFLRAFPKPSISKSRMAVIALAAGYYPDYKRALISGGLSPERVEAMPVAQVCAMGFVADYNEIRDDLLKWFDLPYWQAEKGLKEVEKRLAEQRNRRGALSFAGMLLPALSGSKLAEARAERSIALLRTVEAIRIYAAAHEGRLPNKLAEITAVPLPIDPITGKPFGYQFEGDTGIIKAPVPKKFSGSPFDRIIEIKIAK